MNILENLYNHDYDVFNLVLKYIECKKNYDNVIIDLKKQIELKKCIENNKMYLDNMELRIDVLYSMDKDSEADIEMEDFVFRKKQIQRKEDKCKLNNFVCFCYEDFEEIIF